MDFVNPVFKGLTRPSMLFGIPMIPFILVFGSFFMVAIITQFLLLLLFLIPIFFVMRFLTKRDEHIFHLLFLKLRMGGAAGTNKFFGFKTFVAGDVKCKKTLSRTLSASQLI